MKFAANRKSCVISSRAKTLYLQNYKLFTSTMEQESMFFIPPSLYADHSQHPVQANRLFLKLGTTSSESYRIVSRCVVFGDVCNYFQFSLTSMAAEATIYFASKTHFSVSVSVSCNICNCRLHPGFNSVKLL